jgi:hypothetical protein
LFVSFSFQERTSLIQKALDLDKARPNEARMNSVADTPSVTDLLAIAKKNAAAEKNNAKGRRLGCKRRLQYFTCSPISKIEFLF